MLDKVLVKVLTFILSISFKSKCTANAFVEYKCKHIEPMRSYSFFNLEFSIRNAISKFQICLSTSCLEDTMIKTEMVFSS